MKKLQCNTWITMWGYNVCPLRIGGSRVITTNVWGLFDCKAQPCNGFSHMSECNIMHNNKAQLNIGYKNRTFGKRKRRTMLLYWILKSLACPWSRRNDRWSSTLKRPLYCQNKKSLAFWAQQSCVSHKVNGSYFPPWCKNCNSVKRDNWFFRRTNISKFQYSLP